MSISQWSLNAEEEIKNLKSKNLSTEAKVDAIIKAMENLIRAVKDIEYREKG